CCLHSACQQVNPLPKGFRARSQALWPENERASGAAPALFRRHNALHPRTRRTTHRSVQQFPLGQFPVAHVAALSICGAESLWYGVYCAVVLHQASRVLLLSTTIL